MKPNNNEYRYYIGEGERDLNFRYTEVFPINTDSLSITSSREQDRIFFRRKLNGNPILINNDTLSDYDLLKNIETKSLQFPIRQFVFKITRRGNEFWKGFFNALTCKFDDDRCTCEINNIEVWDKYSCILDNIEQKYNLCDIDEIYECYCANPKQTRETLVINETLNNCSGIFAGGSVIAGYNFIPNVIGGKPDWNYSPKDTKNKYSHLIAKGYACYYWQWKLVDRATKTFTVLSKWARRIMVTIDDNGAITYPDEFGWELLEATTLAGLPAHRFYNKDFITDLGKEKPIEGVNGTQDITINQNGVTTIYPLPIRFWRWNVNFGNQLYKQNRSFVSMIENIVSGCNLKVKSDFIFNTQNYVTGESLNPLNNLLVSSKHDIKRYEAVEPVLTEYYTFKDIETWLRNMFNCYWWIEDDTFRIEHISYFKKTKGINLKTLSNGKYIIGTNKYEYDKNNIAVRERWKFAEAKHIDFIGEDLVYYNNGVKLENDARSIINYDISNMTTDIDYIKLEPSAIAESGFVMFACRINENGEFEVLNEDGLLSNEITNNGHLSLANLMYKYHRYDRNLKYGYLNKEYTEFFSTKKIKKQIDIQFPFCEDEYINEDALITTNMGDGEIESTDLNLKTNMIKLTLIY